MPSLEIVQIVTYFVLLVASVPLLGGYMARVYGGERTWLTPVLAPVERGIYWLSGIDPGEEMRWRGYAGALLLFTLIGFAMLMLLQLLQFTLPLNPAQLPGVGPLLAFNSATSFVTNTNWQAYGGEVTMSYLTQMT